MKIKLISILLFLIGILSLSAIDFGVKYDLIDNHQISRQYFRDLNAVSTSFEYDKHSYSVYAEYPLKVIGCYSTGLGIEHQFTRSEQVNGRSWYDKHYKDWEYMGDYSFTPIYLINKVSIPVKDVSVELLCDVGVNFFHSTDKLVPNSSLSGSTHTGVGLSLVRNLFMLRLIYEVDKGYINSGKKTYTVMNKQTGISIGYRLQKAKK
jgi:hypothetical protein